MQEAAADEQQTQLCSNLACQLHQLGMCLAATSLLDSAHLQVQSDQGCWMHLIQILVWFMQTFSGDTAQQSNFFCLTDTTRLEDKNWSATMTCFATVHSIVLLCKQTRNAQRVIGF